MQKHLESVPDNKFYLLDNDFNRTAKQVFIILMGRAPEGKTDSMDWVTMKNYRHKCRELIQTLETRIQNVAVEERNKNFLSSKQLSFKSRKEGIVSTIGSTTTLSTMVDSIVSTPRSTLTSQSRITANISIVT